MASNNWSAVENLNAVFDTRILEAVKALDNSRLLREVESAFIPPSVQIMLDSQRRIEQLARELSGYDFDSHVTAAMTKPNLADVAVGGARRVSRLTRDVDVMIRSSSARGSLTRGPAGKL